MCPRPTPTTAGTWGTGGTCSPCSGAWPPRRASGWTATRGWSPRAPTWRSVPRGAAGARSGRARAGGAAQPGTRLRSTGRVPGGPGARTLRLIRAGATDHGRDGQGHRRRAGRRRLTGPRGTLERIVPTFPAGRDSHADLEIDLIPITIPELVRLLRDTVIPPPYRDRPHRQPWPQWRRRHQNRPRRAHQRWNVYADITP